ncbi:hypothetical protein [Acidihalobacter ferrooxydans]|uniref:Uncharacterized protein n=1 Tax=Acidihalobacter ferrooxydans TaxID=1765967 RepID=A0A1P8UD82_9GAMM|nr:hypothetical protein [Acidihalobacter ferrooxydans]APZ41778.1 hypothetical protein BW247_00610 [Acidihalobacter ferrooxydans]
MMSPRLPFDECLARLDAQCAGELLRGMTPRDALAVTGLPGPYAPALRMLVDWVPVRTPGQPVTRNELVHALGPLRLRYQAEDVDPEHYRALARLLRAIDAVYDACAAQDI